MFGRVSVSHGQTRGSAVFSCVVLSCLVLSLLSSSLLFLSARTNGTERSGANTHESNHCAFSQCRQQILNSLVINCPIKRTFLHSTLRRAINWPADSRLATRLAHSDLQCSAVQYSTLVIYSPRVNVYFCPASGDARALGITWKQRAFFIA